MPVDETPSVPDLETVRVALRCEKPLGLFDRLSVGSGGKQYRSHDAPRPDEKAPHGRVLHRRKAQPPTLQVFPVCDNLYQDLFPDDPLPVLLETGCEQSLIGRVRGAPGRARRREGTTQHPAV